MPCVSKDSKDWPTCGAREGYCNCGERHYGKLLAELVPGYRPNDLEGRWDEQPWIPTKEEIDGVDQT